MNDDDTDDLECEDVRCECGADGEFAEMEKIPETHLYQVVRYWCGDCVAAERGLMKLAEDEE